MCTKIRFDRWMSYVLQRCVGFITFVICFDRITIVILVSAICGLSVLLVAAALGWPSTIAFRDL